MGENVEYPEVPLIGLVEGRQIARCITGHLIRIDLSRYIRAGVGRRRRCDDPRQSDHSGHCQARNRKHLRKLGHVCLPQHRRPSGVSAPDAKLPDKDVRWCTRHLIRMSTGRTEPGGCTGEVTATGTLRGTAGRANSPQGLARRPGAKGAALRITRSHTREWWPQRLILLLKALLLKIELL